MRSFSITLLTLLSLGPIPIPGAESPLPRKLLLMSVDGTRPDALQAANAPNLDSLFVGSAYSYRAQSAVPVEEYSVSGACYSSMFTGVWCTKHKVCDNEFAPARYDLYPIAFCRLKAVYPQMIIESIVRWAPVSTSMIECADVDLAPSSDQAATDEAVRLLTETNPDLLYYHIEDVDTAGHASGFSPTAAGYLTAIEKADAMVGRVLQALYSRPTYDQEDWMVIALTDHGGKGTSHHYSDEPESQTIFMTFQGAHVAAGEIDPPPVLVDIAVTMLGYFGIEIDPAWNLDGRMVALQADEDPGHLQLPADCDQDGELEISDAVCLLGVLLVNDPVPCGDGTFSGDNLTLLDANGDASGDISDAVYVILHLFGGGSPPVLGTACIPLDTCGDICVE